MNFPPDKGGSRGVENKMDYIPYNLNSSYTNWEVMENIPGVYEDLERKISHVTNPLNPPCQGDLFSGLSLPCKAHAKCWACHGVTLASRVTSAICRLKI